MGIPLEKMVTYDPTKPQGGLTDKQIKDAKVILWHGFVLSIKGSPPHKLKM